MKPTPTQIYLRPWREISIYSLPEDLLDWEELFVWSTEQDRARRTMACRYCPQHSPVAIVQGSSGDILHAFVVETV